MNSMDSNHWIQRLYKTKVRWLCILLVLCSLSLQIYGQDEPQWVQQAIAEAKEYYLIPSSWNAKWGGSITREEVATLSIALYQALGGNVDDKVPVTQFKDTASIDAQRAGELGFMNGIGEGVFAPGDVVKREEMMIVLRRVLNQIGYPITTVEDQLVHFADEDQIAPWAKEAMNDFVSIGIIQGTEVKKLVPKRNTTRAEAASLALRVYEYFKIAPLYEQANQNVVMQGISIGMGRKAVYEKLGEPIRIDQSEYGFQWHIYHKEYKHYLQVGIQDDIVVALYTNDPQWKGKNGIGIGSTQSAVRDEYSTPLVNITKGSVAYPFLLLDQVDHYLEENYYIRFIYDTIEKNQVSGVLLVHQAVERELQGHQGKITEEVRKAYERQLFDLANVERLQRKLAVLQWDDKVAKVAYEHSLDMAKNNYFSHHSVDQGTLESRLKKAKISYQAASENIAMNLNGVLTHHAWMNSEGHRKNILGDYKKLGVGTAFDAEELNAAIYHTQNFYK